MTLDELRDGLPEWAKDTRLNLAIVAGGTSLEPRLAWGTALAAAAASRDPDVLAAVTASSAPHLGDADRRAALAAASVMAMNNVYYRFRHFMGEGSTYSTLPARLRMQVIGNPGIDHRDFELWCLAVSAINGCETCVRAHERVVLDKGGTAEMVHDAVRIAAVIHAAAVTRSAQQVG
jgi:alkyl hydroperoxide reductase subunit D